MCKSSGRRTEVAELIESLGLATEDSSANAHADDVTTD